MHSTGSADHEALVKLSFEAAHELADSRGVQEHQLTGLTERANVRDE